MAPSLGYADWLNARGHYETSLEMYDRFRSANYNVGFYATFWILQIACTSIEVALKAYLLTQTTFASTEEEARKKFRRRDLGHDLPALLKAAQDHGFALVLTQQETTVFARSSDCYASRLWI